MQVTSEASGLLIVVDKDASNRVCNVADDQVAPGETPFASGSPCCRAPRLWRQAARCSSCPAAAATRRRPPSPRRGGCGLDRPGARARQAAVIRAAGEEGKEKTADRRMALRSNRDARVQGGGRRGPAAAAPRSAARSGRRLRRPSTRWTGRRSSLGKHALAWCTGWYAPPIGKTRVAPAPAQKSAARVTLLASCHTQAQTVPD